jgi:hypothetical protein
VADTLSEELKGKALRIFDALFNGKAHVTINNQTYPVETYSPRGEKYITVSKYQFMEQTTLKNSHWAEKARNGDKIMWVLEDWKCIGKVQNGEFSLF